MRTYKHEALIMMRENGELDTQIYPTVKQNMAQIKKRKFNDQQQANDFMISNRDLNALNEHMIDWHAMAQDAKEGDGGSCGAAGGDAHL